MRVKIGKNRHPVLERVFSVGDEFENVFHPDRFRFTLYDTKGELYKRIRTVEIRMRQALVFAKGEVEPMMINVYEWLNLEDQDFNQIKNSSIHSKEYILEIFSQWLCTMNLVASPFSVEFILTEAEAKRVISGWMYRIGMDGFTREYETLIKVL